jgi:hypothetical protein
MDTITCRRCPNQCPFAPATHPACCVDGDVSPLRPHQSAACQTLSVRQLQSFQTLRILGSCMRGPLLQWYGIELAFVLQ